MKQVGSSQFSLREKSSVVADTNPLRMLAMGLLAGSAGGFHFKPALYSQHQLSPRHPHAVGLAQLQRDDAPHAKTGSAQNLSHGDSILKESTDYAAWRIPRKEFISRTTAALVAGASAKVALPATADDIMPQNCIDDGLALYSTRQQSFGTAQGETLISTLKAQPNTRVICVGEEHLHPLHHVFQLNIIKAVHKIDASPTLIGMEMFWREHQAALDDFIFGEVQNGGGSIRMLQDRTQWWANWGYPIKLYADILNYAREKRIRLVGLNAPYPIVQGVGRLGLKKVYSMLPPKVLASMPEVDLDNEEHFQRFQSLSKASKTRFSHTYEAMAFWDDYMAASIATFFTHPQKLMPRMVVLAGLGHVQGRVGIPDRVNKRTFVKTLTVVPRSVPWTAIGAGGFPGVQGPVSTAEGDFVLYTRRLEDLDYPDLVLRRWMMSR